MRILNWNYFFILAFFGLTLVLACDDDGITTCPTESMDTLTCVLYEQTGCSDPWGYHEKDNQLINQLEVYFLNLGVNLQNVDIEDGGEQQSCLACHCTTGRVFKAKVNREDLNIILAEGFEEIH